MDTSVNTSAIPTTPYLQNLMLDVKNMRVKHVRKMFVLLREIGTDLHLSDMEHKTDWAEYKDLNTRLQTLVVQHGLTLGEFATGYVLNIQARQRVSEAEKQVINKPASKRKASSLSSAKSQESEAPKPTKRAVATSTTSSRNKK